MLLTLKVCLLGATVINLTVRNISLQSITKHVVTDDNVNDKDLFTYLFFISFSWLFTSFPFWHLNLLCLVSSEDVSGGTWNVKFKIIAFFDMRCYVMFITAVRVPFTPTEVKMT